jgi:hypothetical protein
MKNSRNLLSKKYMLVFATLFAVIGGIVIWKTFAATAVGLQAEKMRLPKGAAVFNDTAASKRAAVKIKKDVSGGAMTATVTSNDPLTDIVVRAKATACSGNQYPQVVIYATGTTTKKIFNGKINTTGYTEFKAKGFNVSSSNKKYKISVQYTTYSSKKKCQTTLYLDRFTFNTVPAKKGGGGGKTCPAGQKVGSNGNCVCTNKATNVPNCNQCPSGYHYVNPDCIQDEGAPTEISKQTLTFCVQNGSRIHDDECTDIEQQRGGQTHYQCKHFYSDQSTPQITEGACE